MNRIEDLLMSLGITRNYRGYRRTALAIQLAMEREERLEAVTKEIYWEVARLCDCTWTAVERNIRTVVQRAWRVNPARLAEMARYPLEKPPTASQFIALTAACLRRDDCGAADAWPRPDHPSASSVLQSRSTSP